MGVMALVKFILGCVLLCCPYIHQVRNGSDCHGQRAYDCSQPYLGLCAALLSIHPPGQEWR